MPNYWLADDGGKKLYELGADDAASNSWLRLRDDSGEDCVSVSARGEGKQTRQADMVVRVKLCRDAHDSYASKIAWDILNLCDSAGGMVRLVDGRSVAWLEIEKAAEEWKIVGSRYSSTMWPKKLSDAGRRR